MGRTAILPPKHNKTLRMVQEAITEVRQAVRPRRQRGGGKKKESGEAKLLALAAGAAVLWHGFQQMRKEARPGSETDFNPDNLREVPAIAAPPDSTQDAVTVGKADSAPSREAKIAGFSALAKEFYARFTTDECLTRASALAFILVLSLVPLLLFALAIIGFLIQSPAQAADYTQQLISGLLPGQQAGQAASNFIQQAHIAESAQTLMNGKGWALAGGILSLLWAATGLFVSASDPMNRAWDVTETRSLLKLRGTALGVFVGAFTFFALSLVVTSGAHGALARLGVPDSLPPVAAFGVDLLFFLLAALANGGMFTLIYKLLPNTPVSWKSAAFGGLIVGLLLEIFKQGFALYLAHFANFNKIYGTFGGIFLLVTWISYSTILLLAGAILCKMYHELSEMGGVQARSQA